jgi:hypothetical protein
MYIDDIEGTKAKARHSPRQRAGSYNAYDYSDITKAQFVTTRSTNPMNPTYVARDESGNLVEIGEVLGSKP